jgi:hypothetical protein
LARIEIEPRIVGGDGKGTAWTGYKGKGWKSSQSAGLEGIFPGAASSLPGFILRDIRIGACVRHGQVSDSLSFSTANQIKPTRPQVYFLFFFANVSIFFFAADKHFLSYTITRLM